MISEINNTHLPHILAETTKCLTSLSSELYCISLNGPRPSGVQFLPSTWHQRLGQEVVAFKRVCGKGSALSGAREMPSVTRALARNRAFWLPSEETGVADGLWYCPARDTGIKCLNSVIKVCGTFSASHLPALGLDPLLGKCKWNALKDPFGYSIVILFPSRLPGSLWVPVEVVLLTSCGHTCRTYLLQCAWCPWGHVPSYTWLLWIHLMQLEAEKKEWCTFAILGLCSSKIRLSMMILKFF